jgi:hypothetical protein
LFPLGMNATRVASTMNHEPWTMKVELWTIVATSVLSDYLW